MEQSNYKSLIVWQKSISLTKDIYVLTGQFPKEEVYGLVNQIRRSIVSIPSNIAEGNQRQTGKEYRNFLYIAKGFCAELETQILISKELGFITNNVSQEISQRIEELLKMLASLITSIHT